MSSWSSSMFAPESSQNSQAVLASVIRMAID